MVTRWRVALGGAIASALVAAAVMPGSASAIGISAMSTTPSGTQAGSHPNFNLSLSFTGNSTPKALRIDLPPGFVGNPNAAARCPQATFASGGCGPDTVVGSTVVHTIAGIGDATGGGGGGNGGGGGGGGGLPPLPDIPLPDLCSVLPLPILCPSSRMSALKTADPDARPVRFKLGKRRLVGLPIDAQGTVYNLAPNPGEAARLGIAVRPLGGIAGEIRLQSTIEVRDGGDFGLTSSLDGLPAEFNGLATQITGMELTLHGHTAGGGAFVTLPTSCAPATTTVRVTPYSGSAATAQASFTPTGCGAVPFTPTLQVAPSTTRVESNAAYAIRLFVPGDEEPIRQAHVSETTVSLPLGAGLNPGTADGLEVCTEAQFARGQRSAPTCPAASAVGTVSFTSPLVGTLTGTVYEGAPTPGQMLRLFVDVPGPGLRIKLVGDVNPDPRTGQVHSTFRNLPPLPFTAFELTFRGGDKSILTTPDRCGPAYSVASLVPNTGGAAATPQSMFMVDLDGAGTPCPDLPFTPGIAVDVKPSTAGAFTAATTTVTRPERTQRLSEMKVSFPAGLVGGLGGGIGLCELEKAHTGACPANSRVGTAQLVAGPGPKPLRIAGQVFLTAPFDGALAGLAIVVPGKVGPFDLGTTVSMAKIVVRPGDQGLDVTASGLPQVVGGIPLGLREIRLNLDRDGFMRNGTSCTDQQVGATFTSALGATATASAPYRSTACNRVPFRPRLGGVAATRGQLAKGAHPTVTALVTQTENEINARAVTVTLPKEIGVDIANLNRTCPEGEDCGDRNVVGTATAVTPLLPIPLTGQVRLVTPRGGGLPQLKLDLKGLLSLTLTGKTALSPEGRVVNTFEGIPDVPLSRFELTIEGGDGGILLNNRRLRCGEKLTGNAEFTGQSGAEHRARGAFEVCGTISEAASRTAKTRATARLRGKRLVVTVRGARKVNQVRIGLGRTMSISGRRAVSLKATKRARLAVKRRAVAVRGLASRKVVVRLGPKGLKGERKGRRITVKVKMGKQTATLRPRIR